MTLLEASVPLADTGLLFENYSDEVLADFIPKYINAIAQQKIREDLRLADVLAITRNVGQTKEGNRAYSKWHSRKRKQLDDLKDELDYENKTVFEKLKKKISKGTSTVFYRLQKLSGE